MANQPPAVSVIVPTYNRSGLLRETLATVGAQGFRDFELIVADDGSEDDTAATVATSPVPARYLRLEHSGLAARTRNAGIAVAQGRYLAFLDDDDLWHPDKLALQMQALREHADAVLVCGNALRHRPGTAEDGSLLIEHCPREAAAGHGGLAELARGNYVICSTALADAAAVRAVGGFCEDPRLGFAQDYDLWLRLATRGPVAYLDRPLLGYRVGSVNSLTDGTGHAAHRAQLRVIATRLETFCTQYGISFPGRSFHDQLQQRDKAEARRLWRQGRFAEATRLWLRTRAQKLVKAYR